MVDNVQPILPTQTDLIVLYEHPDDGPRAIS